MTKTIVERLKEQRKVVVAKYNLESSFIVPKGLDLEDKRVVDHWYVKYDTLHIYKQNGDHIEIEPYFSASDSDLKRSEEETIQVAHDYGVCDENIEEWEQDHP